jgi:hypothetical protein
MEAKITIDAVRELLAIAPDGSLPDRRLTLDAKVLSSLDPGALLPALLATAFGGAAARLDDAQANVQGQSDTVVVQGTCGFALGKDVPARLTVWLDEQMQVQLLFGFNMIPAVSPAEPWTFSQSFPDLPVPFSYSLLGEVQRATLDMLQLADAWFYAATCATQAGGAALVPGLNFVALVQANGVFGLFQSQVASGAPLVLAGTVRMPGADAQVPALGPAMHPWDLPGVPYGIDLALALPLPALGFGSAMRLQLDRMRIYSPHSKAWLAQNQDYKPVLAWTGALDLPGAKVHADIVAITPMGTGQAAIDANLTGVTLPGLASLAELTGSSDLFAALPEGWTQPSGIGLESVGLVIGAGKGQPALLEASATVGIGQQSWPLWDPYLAVDSLAATFTVRTPFATPELEVRVDGVVRICGTPFNASAFKSGGYQLSLSMADKVNLPLSQLVSTYLPGVTPPSDLTIDSLSLAASPGRYYSFMLAMAEQPNPWTIDIGVTRLVFSDIEMFAMQSRASGLSGSFSGTATVAGLALSARYDSPGDVLIKAQLPPTSLKTLASGLTGGLEVLPDSFDLQFSESWILLQKQGTDYRWEMGTLVDSFGSLAFVAERGGSGWGFAVGLAIAVADVGKLPAVGSAVDTFANWFPFDDFVLAVSSLRDSTFAFPGFKAFGQGALGQSKIQLPGSVQGIDRGFYLYTSTTFTRKNPILGALIDLLCIPEGTQLQAMLSYLTDKKQLQLGVSVTTFLTPLADVSQRTCAGDLGYRNGCLSGTVFAQFQGEDISLGLAATLKTRIQDSPVDFTVILALVENGIFVSGTMDNQRPLDFGPLKLGGLAVELGISFEGVPSFGFSGELDVAGAFDSSLAVLVDSANPVDSMLAAALSDLTLGGIVDKLVGEIEVEVPSPFLDLLNTVGIGGSSQGRFSVDGQDAAAFAKALDNFDGPTISATFTRYGKLPSFPSTSEGLMLFVDTPGKQWYLTEKAGTGGDSTICHWQIGCDAQGRIQVGKEAQLYFVPNPAGTQIGQFYYPAGMLVSGRLQYLFLDLDVDVELVVSKGIRIDAALDKIVLGSERLFSLTSPDGNTGPTLSLSSFSQPSAPEGQRDPHFIIAGKLELLGISRSVQVVIDTSHATFALSGDLVPALVSGNLSGSIGTGSILAADGNVFAGIPDIDLGSLGSWNIKSGVSAAMRIWVDTGDFGAALTAAFELGGQGFNLPEIKLDISTQALADLPVVFFNAVKDFLVNFFKDPKAWVALANKVLAWSIDQISSVLSSVFGLDAATIQAILKTLCPISTALSLL